MDKKEFEQFMAHIYFEITKLAEIVTMDEDQRNVGELLFDIGGFINEIKSCLREENPCETVKRSLAYLHRKWG